MSLSFGESDAPHRVHISWSGLFSWPHSGQVVFVESMMNSFMSRTPRYGQMIVTLGLIARKAIALGDSGVNTLPG
jgi:hypothetical protein